MNTITRCALIALVISLTLPAGYAQSSRASKIAVVAGSMVGKGQYCGIETREFDALAQAKLVAAAMDPEDEAAAFERYEKTVAKNARTGPVDSSCVAFRKTFANSLQELEDAR